VPWDTKKPKRDLGTKSRPTDVGRHHLGEGEKEWRGFKGDGDLEKDTEKRTPQGSRESYKQILTMKQRSLYKTSIPRKKGRGGTPSKGAKHLEKRGSPDRGCEQEKATRV